MDGNKEGAPAGWERLKQLGGPKWYIPPSYVPPVYQDAFTAFFRLENSLRLLVYLVLKELRGAEWDSVVVAQGGRTIRQIAERQIARLRRYSHIGAVPLSPMMYLDLGMLIDLVCANWPSFSGIFRMDCERLRSRLGELKLIRNNLAHFRDVTEKDWENVLGPYLELLVPDIDAYLKEVLPTAATSYPVAGLCPDETHQYEQLLSLKYPPTSFSAHVTENHRWVRINMNIRLVVTRAELGGGSWVARYYRPNYDAIWRGLGRAAAEAVAAYQGYTYLEPSIGDDGVPTGLDKPAWMLFYAPLARPVESRVHFLSGLLKVAQDIQGEYVSAALEDLDNYKYLLRGDVTLKRLRVGPPTAEDTGWSRGKRPELSGSHEAVEDWTSEIPVFQGVQRQTVFPWIDTKVQCIYAPWQWPQADRR